jgi:hypothetical protein
MWPSATPWLQGLARTGGTGMREDGLHPNDKVYRVIADRLGSLGYNPLYPRYRTHPASFGTKVTPEPFGPSPGA